MKANKFCIFRLLAGLAAVAFGAGQASGAVPLMAQQIEMIGARHWFGLMASAIVSTTPVLAPVSRRIKAGFVRRSGLADVDGDETVDHPSWRDAIEDDGMSAGEGAGTTMAVDVN
jgi:hypothetical protein